MCGFSLTSPDLVLCGGSPDVPKSGYGDSPELLERHRYSAEVSLENGINGSHYEKSLTTRSVKFSSMCQILSPESSLELLPPSTVEDELPKDIDFMEPDMSMFQVAESESPKVIQI